MKKIIIIAITCTFLVVGCTNKIDNELPLTGDIIMSNPNGYEVGSYGMAIYNVSKKAYSYFSKALYDDPVFNNDKSKVLGTSQDKIIEYDIKNNSGSILYKNGRGACCLDVCYIPNTDDISFIMNDELYRLDRNGDKSEVFLLGGVSEGYSWSSDGKSVIYSNDGKIYRYDLIKKVSQYMFDGYKPLVSNSGKYIAYLENRLLNNKNTLIVRCIETNDKWERNTTTAVAFRFSPDDREIAIKQSKIKSLFFIGHEIILWDYKNKKSYTMFDDINSPTFGFDWK